VKTVKSRTFILNTIRTGPNRLMLGQRGFLEWDQVEEGKLAPVLGGARSG
jgi:hypothetical protein